MPAGFTRFLRFGRVAPPSRTFVALSLSKSLIWVVRCPWLVPRGHRFGKKPIPPTSPLSTPGTSQEAHPPTPPLTPPLTPPEGTQTKPQVLVGRWLPPYGQEAPL